MSTSFSSRTLSGAEKCRPCVWGYSFCELICVGPVVFWGPFSPWYPPSPLALTLFLQTLLLSSLSPEGRDSIETSCLGISVPSSLTLCVFESLYLCPHLLKEEIFCWWLNMVLIDEYNRMPLGVILLPQSFIRTVVFSFPLNPYSSHFLFSCSSSPVVLPEKAYDILLKLFPIETLSTLFILAG